MARGGGVIVLLPANAPTGVKGEEGVDMRRLLMFRISTVVKMWAPPPIYCMSVLDGKSWLTSVFIYSWHNLELLA